MTRFIDHCSPDPEMSKGFSDEISLGWDVIVAEGAADYRLDRGIPFPGLLCIVVFCMCSKN